LKNIIPLSANIQHSSMA